MLFAEKSENMRFRFYDKKITGILSILPQNEILFEEEMDNYNFSRAKSLKLKNIMGYNKHRIIDRDVCSSDLCIYGMEYLFRKKKLNKNEIDALILVTQSPDHFIPPTSNVIQGKLNLSEDVFCMDINQGCAGYEIGLIEAFSLLGQESVNKVVLLNVDTLSKKVSRHDRNSYPLVGDGATVTVIEKTEKSIENIFVNIKMNGKAADVIKIPAGGFKVPTTCDTSVLIKDDNGNLRSKDHLVMKGDDVFNFVQAEVPPMIDELLQDAGVVEDDVDYYMFHQPNKFMLKKLADKMGVPYEKMPNNIVENFGNSSSCTVPLNICFNLGKRMLEEKLKVCLAGFGVGLSWSSIILDLGKLDYCEIIEFDKRK